MSDKARLLSLLQRYADTWVSLPQIGEVCSPYSVTKRVSELRREGYEVENRLTPVPGARTKSEYRLVTQKSAAA